MRLIASIIIIFVFIAKHLKCIDALNERSLSASTAGMTELLETESAFLQALKDYALKVQQRLDTIRSAVKKMTKENVISQEDPETYLSNPLNAFSLIRRLHIDWANWELFMSQPIGDEQIKAMQKLRLNVPTSFDLREAAGGIIRIQEVYGLKAEDIVNGLLNGKQYDVKFESIDTFTIGTELYREEKYNEAAYWVYTALQTYDQTSPFYEILNYSKLDIYELYTEIMLQQKRPKDALTLIETALMLSSNEAKYFRKKNMIQHIIDTDKSQGITHLPIAPTDEVLGCRGQFANRNSKLHCRYNTKTNSFLKIAPLKMEEVELDPYIVLYHDVISDAEIANIKDNAKPNMQRAIVYEGDNKTSLVVNRRTAKTSWLHDNLNDVTVRLNQRINDMTGFNLDGSEMLQVMNYGLGGNYMSHFDYFNASMGGEVTRMEGDRIATLLFYMSNVEQGGATVFPYSKTAVFPIKGSALIWNNLDHKGDCDYRSLHAACPVIVGSKWVFNKWIRERNQVFTRPCNKE